MVGFHKHSRPKPHLVGQPDDLSDVLDLWMWESPTELIPTYEQIREVRGVLKTRPDAQTPQTRALIAGRDEYLALENGT